MKSSVTNLATLLLTALTGLLVSCDPSSPTQGEPNASGGKTPDSLSTGVTLEGRTYRTVKIGRQNWMAENLEYKGVGNDTVGACYQSSQDSCKKYGRLYRWAEVMKLADSCNAKRCSSQVQPRHQGICPTGWHVPNDADWDSLIASVGGSAGAGYKIMAKTGWERGMNGTDQYGFTLLPAGFRLEDGSSLQAGSYAFSWSASEPFSTISSCWFSNTAGGLVETTRSKKNGYSLRCLQD